jgi:hypothetical protein
VSPLNPLSVAPWPTPPAAQSRAPASTASPTATTAEPGWSEKRVRLAQNMRVGHAFLWEYSYKRLQLAQLLGQLGVFLTWMWT